MTPSQYLAVARDLVILTAIGLLLWWVYRVGENAVKAGDLKALQAQITQQAKTQERWHQESIDANTQLSKDMAAINSAPVVQHVWVRQPSCPRVLSAPAGKASDSPAVTGGAQSGRGDAATADRRDFAVAEFKRKWEGILAGCRSLDSQWPR